MRFELTYLGVVSALGIGVAETERRMFAGDASGMKPVEGLVGGDRTVFGDAVPCSSTKPLTGHFLGAAIRW